MKDFPLNFRKFSDERPVDGQEIFYIDENDFARSYEFRYATAEYQWEEHDERGPTGTSYVFEEGEPQPPNTRLMVIVDRKMMQPNTLWIACTAVETVLEQVDES